MKRHLNRGDSVNAEDNNGATALLHAFQNGHKDVAEMLIAKGTYVNAKNNIGYTPLRAATKKGHKDVVELLKQHGAK